MKDFKALIQTGEYDFLRKEEKLGRNLILLGLGGSYAYGTYQENSDIDFRGIALNRPSDLLGLTSFEQYEDDNTDTVIYSFNKMVKLLLECNPNTCEILGLEEEQYLIKTDLGQELLDRKALFLSKRAAKSFGGYAGAQLRRLQNAIARDALPQQERERHILNSVRNALEDFERRYGGFSKGNIHLYIDKAENPELETEIFVDAGCRHMPLRDYENMWSVMHNVVKDYDKIGKRNRKKDDNHLNKHAMHLIRLFMMAVDILEKGEIITCRRQELDLLLKIRSGGFLREDKTFVPEFYDILEDYEKRMEKASRESSLPDNPDMEKVEEFVEYVNRKAIEGDYLEGNTWY
nr:nucleotidyltransferase domain-containing protein [uncultured Eisenbergiella sp.]